MDGVSALPERLVWIDVETTGLDPERHALLEIAVVVTDSELNILADPYTTPVVPTTDVSAALSLGTMDDVVLNMHISSGLLNDLSVGGLPTDEAEAEALDYVRRYVPVARVAPLAGSSVGFDRSFLVRQMPDLARHLHYRNVDVSTVKELASRWYPEAAAARPRSRPAHRALPDILASISELAYWRSTIFSAAVPTRSGA